MASAGGSSPCLDTIEKPMKRPNFAHRPGPVNRPERRSCAISVIPEVGRAYLFGDVTVQVIEHEADVAVDVPVERHRVDELPAASDAIGHAELIVEVHQADAAADFPCTPAVFGQREWMGRHEAG